MKNDDDDTIKKLTRAIAVDPNSAAVSCAQCLAVVVANPRLLEIPCGTVEQMNLVNTFCWLDEYSNNKKETI